MYNHETYTILHIHPEIQTVTQISLVFLKKKFNKALREK